MLEFASSSSNRMFNNHSNLLLAAFFTVKVMRYSGFKEKGFRLWWNQRKKLM